MRPAKVEVVKVANGYLITPIFRAAVSTPEELQVIESDTGGVPYPYERLGEKIVAMLDQEFVDVSKI